MQISLWLIIEMCDYSALKIIWFSRIAATLGRHLLRKDPQFKVPQCPDWKLGRLPKQILHTQPWIVFFYVFISGFGKYTLDESDFWSSEISVILFNVILTSWHFSANVAKNVENIW